MLGEQIAGKYGGDLLVAVERHIHREVNADHLRDLPNIVVDGIALGYAPRCVRMTDSPRVVKDQHRLESGKSGGDHFGSAAEPGEKVRLDESGRDSNIGSQPLTIQVDRDTSRGLAEIFERSVVPAVVVDNAVPPGDVGTEHLLQFCRGVRPMGARRDQNRHILGTHLRQFLEERLERLSTRLRTSHVADRNRHLLPPSDELADRPAAGGRAESREQSGMRIGYRRPKKGSMTVTRSSGSSTARPSTP